LDETQIALLIHIYVLGVPMLGASIFLLVVTVKIRRFLERYAIQRTIFRGILLAGYLFVFISVLHIAAHALEWYGYDLLALEVEGIWHGVMLLVLLVLSYSFYQYYRTLSSAERGQ
jgi:hypothetical protein